MAMSECDSDFIFYTDRLISTTEYFSFTYTIVLPDVMFHFPIAAIDLLYTMHFADFFDVVLVLVGLFLPTTELINPYRTVVVLKALLISMTLSLF